MKFKKENAFAENVVKDCGSALISDSVHDSGSDVYQRLSDSPE